MPIEDFLHEEITEGEFDFDFYILYMQTECDDPYYAPYTTNIGIYKSKENAIKSARGKFYKMAEDRITSDQRKYGGVEGIFYIEGNYFKDRGSEVGQDEVGDEERKKKWKGKRDRQMYTIYDKEEEGKRSARWERMHKTINKSS